MKKLIDIFSRVIVIRYINTMFDETKYELEQRLIDSEAEEILEYERLNLGSLDDFEWDEAEEYNEEIQPMIEEYNEEMLNDLAVLEAENEVRHLHLNATFGKYSFEASAA